MGQGHTRTVPYLGGLHCKGYRLAMTHGNNGTGLYRGGPVPKKLHITRGTGWQWDREQWDRGAMGQGHTGTAPYLRSCISQGVQAGNGAGEQWTRGVMGRGHTWRVLYLLGLHCRVCRLWKNSARERIKGTDVLGQVLTTELERHPSKKKGGGGGT